jgi:hypothetical protein
LAIQEARFNKRCKTLPIGVLRRSAAARPQGQQSLRRCPEFAASGNRDAEALRTTGIVDKMDAVVRVSPRIRLVRAMLRANYVTPAVSCLA